MGRRLSSTAWNSTAAARGGSLRRAGVPRPRVPAARGGLDRPAPDARTAPRRWMTRRRGRLMALYTAQPGRWCARGFALAHLLDAQPRTPERWEPQGATLCRRRTRGAGVAGAGRRRRRTELSPGGVLLEDLRGEESSAGQHFHAFACRGVGQAEQRHRVGDEDALDWRTHSVTPRRADEQACGRRMPAQRRGPRLHDRWVRPASMVPKVAIRCRGSVPSRRALAGDDLRRC